MAGLWLALLTLALAWPAAALLLHALGQRVPSGTWDAIAVAGARVMADGRPSGALARRTRLAVDLWRQGLAPRIVLTGGVGDHPPSEARAAADLAASLGVPREALVLEERSTTTEENARLAREVLGPARVLVVSDAYHALRCGRVFGHYFQETAATGAPVPALSTRLRMGMREVVVLAFYGLRGWL